PSLLCSPRATVFPYTTLFRSVRILSTYLADRHRGVGREGAGARLAGSSVLIPDWPMGPRVCGLAAGRKWIQTCMGLFVSSSHFGDRKSTRLNSSRVKISYAVF